MADTTPPLSQQLGSYLDSLVPARHPELESMEQWAQEHRFPIVGPASGNLCYLVARMIGARQVYELGSGYGYSTAWFCRAVQEKRGRRSASRRVGRRAVAACPPPSGGTGRPPIWCVTTSARRCRRSLRRTIASFDLIFNDIDKDGYPKALPGDRCEAAPRAVC